MSFIDGMADKSNRIAGFAGDMRALICHERYEDNIRLFAPALSAFSMASRTQHQ